MLQPSELYSYVTSGVTIEEKNELEIWGVSGQESIVDFYFVGLYGLHIIGYCGAIRIKYH